MIKEELHAYYNRERDKKREIGHYHCSEISSILKGYTNPTNFFKQKPMDKEGQANVFRGEAMEARLQAILKERGEEFIDQERLEMEIAPNVFLSGKTDFSYPDKILETKCPRDLTIGIPDKWKCQLESYFRMSGKPVFLGIFQKNGDEIIRFYPYYPDDKLWEDIIRGVIDFDMRLRKKWKQI